MKYFPNLRLRYFKIIITSKLTQPALSLAHYSLNSQVRRWLWEVFQREECCSERQKNGVPVLSGIRRMSLGSSFTPSTLLTISVKWQSWIPWSLRSPSVLVCTSLNTRLCISCQKWTPLQADACMWDSSSSASLLGQDHSVYLVGMEFWWLRKR